MYAYLLQRLPKWLVLMLTVGVQTAVILAIVLLAEKPFGEFVYMRL